MVKYVGITIMTRQIKIMTNAATQGFQPFSSTSLKFQLLEIIYNVMAPNKEGKKSLRLYNIIAERIIMTANMKT